MGPPGGVGVSPRVRVPQWWAVGGEGVGVTLVGGVNRIRYSAGGINCKGISVRGSQGPTWVVSSNEGGS